MSKEKVLHNPISSYKKRSLGRTQEAWRFDAPSYDNRTSCSISAGDNYGVGPSSPIGSFKTSSYESGPIPLKSRAFSPNEAMRRDEAG